MRPRHQEIILIIILVSVFVVFVIAGFLHNYNLMWGGIVLFILLVLVVTDTIEEISASMTGFKAKTRELSHKLSELHKLADVLATVAIETMDRSGRFGGVSNKFVDERIGYIQDILAEIGFSPDDLNKVIERSNHKRTISFDYASVILSIKGSGVINTGDLKGYDSLKNGGIENPPTPFQIEQALKEWDLMYGEITNWVEDYKHYYSSGMHKRPDVFYSSVGKASTLLEKAYIEKIERQRDNLE